MKECLLFQHFDAEQTGKQQNGGVGREAKEVWFKPGKKEQK
jgi:hypothetical protein